MGQRKKNQQGFIFPSIYLSTSTYGESNIYYVTITMHVCVCVCIYIYLYTYIWFLFWTVLRVAYRHDILFPLNTSEHVCIYVNTYVYIYSHASLNNGDMFWEKCITRWFHHGGNITERTHTNLDGIAQATNLYSMLLYWILEVIVTQW